MKILAVDFDGVIRDSALKFLLYVIMPIANKET